MRIPLDGLFDSAHGREVSFPPGDVLVRAGEPADHVLLLMKGRARVSTAEGLELSVLEPGDLIGELSILAGGTRSADVTAVDAITALRFERDEFVRLVVDHPDVERAISEEIVRRLDEHHVAGFVTRVLGIGTEIPFDDLRRHLNWRWVRAGERLYSHGETGDSGYIVITGRLRVVGVDDDGSEVTVGEIGPDEFIGESAIFEPTVRRSTIQAIRDSLVAEITRSAAVTLLGTYPAALAPLLIELGVRARRAPGSRARRSVALCVTTPAPGIAENLHREMSRSASCALVSDDWIDARLDQPGAAKAEPGEPTESRLLQLLHEVELSHRYMLLETGPDWTKWSERAARHADRLVACISSSPDEREMTVVDRLYAAGPEHAERVLVFVHPPGTDRPRSSASWAARWNVHRIVHVVGESEADVARLGRLLTGRSVGLVLGGGGARGFAHLGARRALEEAGVPIDIVGGTSIGSALGGTIAMRIPHDENVRMIEKLFRGLLDYTIPVVSLVKGEAITRSITEAYADWTFEDLWLPFFCMSTNITRSSETVHRRGELVTPIRASVSIPGVMPPVAWGNDLLVDGGVLNNLPADVMRPEVEEGPVIAIDVAPPEGPRAKGDMALSVSGWTALRSRTGKGRASYPGVTAMLMRTMIAGSVRKKSQMITDGYVDFYLDLDLRGVSLLEFETVRPVVAAGYEAAAPRIEAWLESRGGATW